MENWWSPSRLQRASVSRLPRMQKTNLLVGIVALLFSAAPQSAQGPVQQMDMKLPPLPLPPVLQNYKTVTSQRLLKPEDGDWLMPRRTFDGWGYSPLAQITPQNIQRLQPMWVLATGMNNGHEAVPV